MFGFSMKFKENSAHSHALKDFCQLLNKLNLSVKYALKNKVISLKYASLGITHK